MGYKLTTMGLMPLKREQLDETVEWHKFGRMTVPEKIRHLRSVRENGHRKGTRLIFQNLARVEWFDNCVLLISRDGEETPFTWIEFGTLSMAEKGALLCPPARRMN